MVPYSLDNFLKADLGREGMAVVDNRLAILPVPAIKLHASTTLDGDAW